jgi:hypothetical protein
LGKFDFLARSGFGHATSGIDLAAERYRELVKEMIR